MAIVSKLLGNATRIKPEKAEKRLKNILIENETVQLAFIVFRDMTVFTNFRIILVDKKGATGLKTEYHSILYKSVFHFSVTSSGTVDLDSELRIWIVGQIDPIEIGIRRSKQDLYDIQKVLATHITKS